MLTVLLALWLAPAAHSAVRFDVFPGYDGIVPEGSWFPFVFEISNDGPAFNGVVKVAPSQFDQSSSRLIPVELPTGTLKRLSLPVFASGRYVINWDAQLLDEKGKVVAETLGLRARKVNPWTIPLAAALSRTPPVLPAIKPRQEELQPVIARLQASVFPDNPIALEGLQTIYITSEKALDLAANQANALLGWLHNGGHLVVGVDQLVQVNGTEWLRKVLPCQLSDMAMSANHGGLQEWLVSETRHDGKIYNRDTMPALRRSGRSPAEFANPYANLTPDETFERAPMQVATAKLRDGRVLMGSAAEPLAIMAPRGRGQITTLLFSPELEPFVSWKNRPHFWAKLTAVPPELFMSDQFSRYGGYSIDGVFGAMIDSKQVRKLPIGWLLLLLLGYLVVIGPLDYYWLKKINRQMLTWITFPIYVALFSVLIYFIGYKLRAGETEWNELHVVDVLPIAGEAEFRGRTYASVYSPVNATYRLASEMPFATLRGEYLGSHGGQEGSHARVTQIGNSFQAEAAVPVWTSQLFISDWIGRDTPPVTVKLAREQRGWIAEVENALDRKVRLAAVVVDDQFFELGEIAAESTARIPLTNGTVVSTFVHGFGATFSSAVSSRQQAFRQQHLIHDLPRGVMAASLVAHAGSRTDAPGYGQFVTPPGFDLSPLTYRDYALFMAWVDNYAAAKPMHKFNPRRQNKDTLLRMAIPTQGVP